MRGLVWRQVDVACRRVRVRVRVRLGFVSYVVIISS